MELTNVKKVGIIGAGVAGLSTAKLLIQQGLECVVFERGDTLGGVWADGYANFGVQVQQELYEFPDWPLPKDVPNFAPRPGDSAIPGRLRPTLRRNAAHTVELGSGEHRRAGRRRCRLDRHL